MVDSVYWALKKVVFLLTLLPFGGAMASMVVVKRGDTLSEIAQRYLGSPVYPKDGSLSKLKSANPGINDLDLLLPGQTIELGILPKEAISSSQPTEESDRLPADLVVAPDGPLKEVPQSASAKSEESSDQSFFISPELLFTQINAVDKVNGGTLRATDGNYGINLGYSQKW